MSPLRKLASSVLCITLLSIAAQAAPGTPARRPRLRAQPNYLTPDPATAPAPDAPLDQEPVVLTNDFPGTQDKTFTAYMKKALPSGFPGGPIIWVSPGTGGGVKFPLTMPTDGDHATMVISGDPAAAQNPTSPSQCVSPCVNGDRMYVVGTSYDTNWTQLTLWHTDTGGQSQADWSAPVCVTGTGPTGDSNNQWDKPAVDVSQFPSTRGHVYVAGVFLPRFTGGGPRRIGVFHSADGGNTFGPETQISVPDYAHTPQIVVDSNTGYIYLLYLDRDLNQLHILRSMDNAGSFSEVANSPFQTPRLLLFKKIGNVIVRSDTIDPGLIKAPSMLVARYNPVARQIVFVFHAREFSDTDSCPTNWWIGTYSTAGAGFHLVENGWNGAQWNPSVDADSAGNYVVAAYDRRDDIANDLKYREYFTKVSSNLIGMEETYLTYQSPVNQTTGEYQDIRWWNGKWYASFIYNDSAGATTDVYLVKVNP